MSDTLLSTSDVQNLLDIWTDIKRILSTQRKIKLDLVRVDNADTTSQKNLSKKRLEKISDEQKFLIDDLNTHMSNFLNKFSQAAE